MSAAEQEKYRKHELAYSHTGNSFVAFVCSSFGALGPLLFDIELLWLRWNCANMRLFVVYKVWISWILVRESSILGQLLQV
jgi:hypothetical protein